MHHEQAGQNQDIFDYIEYAVSSHAKVRELHDFFATDADVDNCDQWGTNVKPRLF